MSISWRKLGLLYDPQQLGRHPKLHSHAANPLPIQLDGDLYRIFYSGRDVYNRSSVGAVDIDIIKRKIITEYELPFFEHGRPGSFFSDGVSIGNCYYINDICYMLFMGWQAPKNKHWRGDIGRLIVNPDLTLTLDSERPFLGSHEIDPVSLSYPWVIKNEDGSYSMWYGSTKHWNSGNDEMIHVIHYASSSDGNVWHRCGLAIPYEIGVAQAFSRPAVIKDDRDRLHMWFSYRNGTGQKYRIGYAQYDNGHNWNLRLNESGIDVSATGWDSEMIEYPYVFEHAGAIFMLYNGNGYGKTGFGLAVIE